MLLRLGLGWFGGVITRRAQEASRRAYDYRIMLEEDQSTLSVKLPLEAYSTDICERNSGGLGAARARCGCTVGRALLGPDVVLERTGRGGHQSPMSAIFRLINSQRTRRRVDGVHFRCFSALYGMACRTRNRAVYFTGEVALVYRKEDRHKLVNPPQRAKK